MRGNSHVRFLGEPGARKGPRLTRRRTPRLATTSTMNHTTIPAALALLLSSCTTERRPPPRSQFEAELAFVTAYAAPGALECDPDAITLSVDDLDIFVYATEPETVESSWRLRTCKRELALTLDCVQDPRDVWCRSHEWPEPKHELPMRYAAFDAAVRAAPPCPANRSCIARGQCKRDRMTLAGPLYPRFDRGPALYTVLRCGSVTAVAVNCSGNPPSCVGTPSAAVPAE